MDYTVRFPAGIRTLNYTSDMTFTGLIGTVCMFPLRAIIAASVALRIHPNTLTFIGVLINSWAAYKLALGHFISAGFVMVASFAMMFTVMTSYTRARAESLIEKCKVGFMERPERIVLFMIGAFTNRMAAVLWVILVLSILAVANRIYYTYLALNSLPMPRRDGVAGIFNRAFFWTDERATLPYDLWVMAILAFVWLTPPDWLGDPTASGPGLIGLVAARF